MAITAEITFNNSKNINSALKAMLIKQTFGVPIALVKGISDNLNNPEKWKQRPSFQPSNVALTTSQAVNVLADSMRRPTHLHYAFYRALLIGMDKLLRNPDIKASKTNVQLNKSVSLAIELDQGRVLLKRINLLGTFLGLAPITLSDKIKIGSSTFWKHTGQAEQAFSLAVRERLASLSPYSFIKSIGKPITSTVKNGRVSFAKFEYKLGTPSWNSQMDEIITAPFVTGRINKIFNKSPRLRQLHGVERIIAAEATRPMLRQLAAKAGSALKQELTGQPSGAVIAPQQGIQFSLRKESKAATNKSALAQRIDNLRKLYVD